MKSKARSESTRRLWADPEWRARATASMVTARKRMWETPEYRDGMIAMLRSPEKSAKQSQLMKTHWADPEWAAMMRAKQSIAARARRREASEGGAS